MVLQISTVLNGSYVLLKLLISSLGAELIRIKYDVERMARAIETSGLPMEFATALRNGRNIADPFN